MTTEQRNRIRLRALDLACRLYDRADVQASLCCMNVRIGDLDDARKCADEQERLRRLALRALKLYNRI